MDFDCIGTKRGTVIQGKRIFELLFNYPMRREEDEGLATEYSYDNFENGLTPNGFILLAICAITSHLKFSDYSRWAQFKIVNC